MYRWQALRFVGFLALASAAAMAGSTATASIITWDPTADFSVTSGNPNGVWTYGYYNVGFTGFTPYSSHNTSPSPSWLGNIGGDGTPVIWKNTTGSTSYGVAPGQISLHPGPGQQPSVIRWTAPADLIGPTASITGQFYAGDGGTMLVGIRENSSWIWNATDHGTFNLTEPVAPGDMIEFAVYGGYSYGNTPLSAQIAADVALPEPASLLGLTLAALALLARVRRPRTHQLNQIA